MSRTRLATGLVAVAAVFALGSRAPAAMVLGPVEFADPTEFGHYFTHVSSSHVAFNAADDEGHGAGGYIEHPTNTFSHRAFVYDPDDAVGGAGQTFTDFTADVDFRANDGGAGVGFYFHGSRTDAHWAFFQVDEGGLERVRFFRDRNSTTGSGGALATGSSDRTADTTLTLDDWVHVRLDVQNVNGGSQVQATLSAWASQTNWSGTPLFSETFTYTAGESDVSDGEVGVSIFYGGVQGGQAVDNFALYQLGTAPARAASYVPLTGATETYSPSSSLDAASSIDNVFSASSRGWAISNQTGVDQTAVFQVDGAPLHTAALEILTFVLESNDPSGAAQHILGKFRISATGDPDPTVTSGATWTVLEPISAFAAANSLTINGDQSIIAGTTIIPGIDTYTIEVEIPTSLSHITGFRLEALADVALPSGGPGLASNGNFVLSHFAVLTRVPEPSTLALAGLGLAAIGLVTTRRRRRPG